MEFKTADLCDRFAQQQHLQIVDPLFKAFTAQTRFSGQITTLKVFEDNRLIRSVLEEAVCQRVLVIDGGGSKRCALLDESLALLAVENGWQGILVYGCIRNAERLKPLPIGIAALNAHPMPSGKHGFGERDILLTFAGVNFKKEHYLYADDDGIIVAESKLD